MSIEERIWELDINETDRSAMLHILEIAEVVRMHNESQRNRSFRDLRLSTLRGYSGL